MLKGLAPKLFFNYIGRYVTVNLKNRSDIILRLWTDHCEYIMAQRLRRGQQMISHYRKIWDEKALKDLFQCFRRQFQRRATGILLSSVGLLSFDWESERITYDSIRKHFDELDFVLQLQKETITCPICGKRLPINAKIEGIEYCRCPKENNNYLPKYTLNERNGSGRWQPYLERENIIVWRRKESHGLYAYKVYASYPDISAEDFLYIQTDVEYRKQWDKTAVELKIVDTDPQNQKNSHIIYWELLWPKLFSNRDYVFNRRYCVDRKRKVIAIVSRSIRHPCCPIVPTNHRVHEYWSYMIIKPREHFKKPGLEYVLTYFDNPGVVLPPAITAWVAQKQMPDFLNKLYCATVEYSRTRKLETKKEQDWCRIRDPGFEYPPDPEFRYHETEDDVYENGKEDHDNTSNKDKDSDILLDDEPDENHIQKSTWRGYFFASMLSSADAQKK